VTSTVSDAEKLANDSAADAKHQAIDAFDAEVAKVEKKVDEGLKLVCIQSVTVRVFFCLGTWGDVPLITWTLRSIVM